MAFSVPLPNSAQTFAASIHLVTAITLIVFGYFLATTPPRTATIAVFITLSVAAIAISLDSYLSRHPEHLKTVARVTGRCAKTTGVLAAKGAKTTGVLTARGATATVKAGAHVATVAYDRAQPHVADAAYRATDSMRSGYRDTSARASLYFHNRALAREAARRATNRNDVLSIFEDRHDSHRAYEGPDTLTLDKPHDYAEVRDSREEWDRIRSAVSDPTEYIEPADNPADNDSVEDPSGDRF